MQRQYESILQHHLQTLTQMAFIAGPRQVGKTTITQHLLNHEPGLYLNWDIIEDRQLLLSGPTAIMAKHSAPQLGQAPPLTVIDEIHKFKDWKNYLKGFYDQYHRSTRILVTGSSRLDIFVKGGDSLMGRYFPYTVHPLTVGELLRTEKITTTISPPQAVDSTVWDRLWEFGGFPDPYLRADSAFSTRCQSLRRQQLFKEDIVDLSQVSDIAQLEVLAAIIESQTGQLINYSGLARIFHKFAINLPVELAVIGLQRFC